VGLELGALFLVRELFFVGLLLVLRLLLLFLLLFLLVSGGLLCGLGLGAELSHSLGIHQQALHGFFVLGHLHEVAGSDLRAH